MEPDEPLADSEGITPPEGIDTTSPDRKTAFLALGIAIGVCLLVFGVILPQLVDWDEVFELLREVDPVDLTIILILALVRYVPAGWMYSIVLPGLSVRNGIETWVATTAVASTLPGFDLVLRVAMYASYGYPLERATSGMVLSGVVEMSTRLTVAVVAVTIWALIEADVGLLGVAGIATAVLVALGTAVAMALRSEEATRKIAARIERLVGWVLGKVDRQAPSGLIDRLVDTRVEAREVLGRRWPQAFLAAVSSQALVFAILTLSLRTIGVGSDVIGLADILMVQGVVIILTSVPITPGSIGVAELIYVGLFTAIAGQEWSAFITAGVILYRLAVWLLPIPIGWLLALRWESKFGVDLFSSTEGNRST